jgi:hypothetical protein
MGPSESSGARDSARGQIHDHPDKGKFLPFGSPRPFFSESQINYDN